MTRSSRWTTARGWREPSSSRSSAVVLPRIWATSAALCPTMPRAMTTPPVVASSTGSPGSKSPSTSTIPAASRERLPWVIAWTAPSSRTRRPLVRAAWASHSRRVLLRRPVGANHVPTGSPASACAALSAAVSTTGTPALVAMDAASSLVTMPPVPIAGPRPVTSTFSRSAGAPHRHTGAGRDGRGLELRAHAAGADRGAASGDLDVLQVLRPTHLRHPPGARAGGRPVVQAVDVGEEDEDVGADEMGDEGGE